MDLNYITHIWGAECASITLLSPFRWNALPLSSGCSIIKFPKQFWLLPCKIKDLHYIRDESNRFKGMTQCSLHTLTDVPQGRSYRLEFHVIKASFLLPNLHFRTQIKTALQEQEFCQTMQLIFPRLSTYNPVNLRNINLPRFFSVISKKKKASLATLRGATFMHIVLQVYQPSKPQWLPYVLPGLTFSNSTFYDHSVFMRFVWIWEQTPIISLCSINSLVFITETKSVYCEVRNRYI
jgi:hypothetical protein